MENNRREEFGEMKSDIKYLRITCDKIHDGLETHKRDIYSKVNANSKDIARIKGIGAALSAIWSACIGWLFTR